MSMTAPVDLQHDFFALFGLPRSFAVDENALESAYHDLHSKVHPDRHAHLPDADKRRAMQWATRVNEAFTRLRKPLPRALYLLELNGIDAGLETNTAMSPEFLMEQMEWREAVEEARDAADMDELSQLHQRLRVAARGLIDTLHNSFDVAGDLQQAAEVVRRLMFLEKLQHEIDDALEALED